MDIRNVAIIAHVDHGKTTLVDALLRQSKTKMNKDTAETLIMDNNDLERERGITIFSKNASVMWGGIKINIIDTPGHADFGGEVERVLKMADGCLLLVDSKEGPMPQTWFVLKKALEMNLKVVVVVSKIDKSDTRINYVLDKTLEVFLELGANNETADFPIVYTSAKEQKAGLKPNLSEMADFSAVFEAIIKHIPAASIDPQKPLQMLITTLASNAHKGRIAIGRIYSGKLNKSQDIVQLTRDGKANIYKVTSLSTFEGLGKVEIETAQAGDIVAIAGIENPNIGETIADPKNPERLPHLSIEEPTIHAAFTVNNSPFAGKEGEFKTSRQIRDRLFKELETDMALKVEDLPQGGWKVSGRGELHLAILIERMRREGYEFGVGRPQVINKETKDGQTHIPYERVYIEVPEHLYGTVMQKMGVRRAQLQSMHTTDRITYLEFIISTKGLFGYRGEFLIDTQGKGIINESFLKYDKDNGYEHQRLQGSLVAFETGTTNMYGLTNAQDRGTLFFGPAIPVYKGQIIGKNARSDDMRVNVCKVKHLTNMRSKGEGVSDNFKTPKIMSLEEALEFIADDELIEVTPQNIRMRKIILDEVEERRKRPN